MSIIVPAILPTSRRDLVQKLGMLSGLVDEVQVDIVDGLFATPATWPYDSGQHELAHMLAEGAFIPHSGECRIEVDLMVQNPEASAGAWIELGASRLTIHAGSSEHLKQLLKSFTSIYGRDKTFATGLLSVGVAIRPGTDPEILTPYLDQLDYVQFMGIRHIGRQGEPFDASVFTAIASFRRRHPAMPVQVDGGISLTIAPKLLELGVSRLVVGSALWRAPDLAQMLAAFKELTEEHGIYE